MQPISQRYYIPSSAAVLAKALQCQSSCSIGYAILPWCYCTRSINNVALRQVPGTTLWCSSARVRPPRTALVPPISPYSTQDSAPWRTRTAAQTPADCPIQPLAHPSETSCVVYFNSLVCVRATATTLPVPRPGPSSFPLKTASSLSVFRPCPFVQHLARRACS